MDIRCEKCGTEYEFDEDRVGAHGVTVKCTACGYVFKVRRINDPSATAGRSSPTREWLVKKPDGQMIGFRELTTLQKWIVEGRIGRDDEISKNGETWKRLGNIVELEPFFSVFEKARQLNLLIDQGQLSLEPLEIRGSEVLSPQGPILGVSPARAPLVEGPRATTAASNDIPILRNLSQDVESEPVALNRSHDASNVGAGRPPSPASLPLGAPALGGNQSSTAGSTLASGPSSNPATAAMSLVEAPLSTASSVPDSTSGSSESPGRPNWVRRSSLPREPSRSDVVAAFSRNRQRHALISGVVLVSVAALGGGAALVVYRPDSTAPLGNNLGGFDATSSVADRAADSETVQTAQFEANLDGIDNLEESSRLLNEALRKAPDDAHLMAARALVLTRYAETLRSWASDLEDEAARTAARANSKDPGATGGPANDSASARAREAAGLRDLARTKKEEASSILREAFELARQSYKTDPKIADGATALAAYYQVQRYSSAYEREIGRARRLLEARNVAIDPMISTIEAADLIDRAGSDRVLLDKASSLLDQALGARPSMNRARILRARIHMLLNSADAARKELVLVLASAPGHEEANRLIRRLSDPSEPSDPNGLSDPNGPSDSNGPSNPNGPGNPNARGNERSPEKPPRASSGGTEETSSGAASPVSTTDLEQQASFDTWMATGHRQRRADRASRAVRAYEKAAELKPDAPEPLAGMGWAYIDLDKPKSALESFRRALKLNERFAEAYYGLAESHRVLGNHKEAIAAYETFLRKTPASHTDRKEVQGRLDQLRKQVPAR